MIFISINIFKRNCSKLLLVMHAFSLFPAFAIEGIENNIDSKDAIEYPISVSEKLESESVSIGDDADSLVEIKPNLDSAEDESSKAELLEDKNIDSIEDKVKEDAPLKEQISNNNNSNNEDYINKNNINQKNDNNTNSDAALKSLGFYNSSVGELTEAFNPDKKEYTAIIKGTATTFRIGYNSISTRSTSSKMDIFFNEEIVYENIAYTTDKTLTLVKGKSNILKIIVTAENGNQETYKVNIIRESYNDTTLSEIKFGNATLSEEFNPNIKDYTATVKGNQTNVSVHYFSNNIKAKDPYATLTVYFNDEKIKDGNSWVFGTPTAHNDSLSLPKGKENIMRIVVTAESGVQDTYTIDFEREGQHDTTLSEIKFGNASLTEEFSPEKQNYIAVVEENQTVVNFHFAGYNIKASDPYAELTVYLDDKLIKQGNSWAFGTPAAHHDKLPLVNGADNILTVVVTSEKGEKATYTIDFERAGFNDTTLSEIKFTNASLTEEFNPEKKKYTVKVNESQTSINFHYVSNNIKAKDAYAKLTIFFNNKKIKEDVNWGFGSNVAHAEKLDLVKGISNIMEIVVTAENGDQSTYTLSFERETDSNTNITNLALNKGSLELKNGTYIATMDSWRDISVSKLVLEDMWANYKIVLNNKREISINEEFDLEIGDNKLDIEVTSNNGTKKTYPVVLKRTDNASPTASHTKDKEDWTKENVLIKIESSDDSGIRYIELPNGEKVYSNKTEFYANQNGTYKFKVYDNFLNETIETVNISNIDKEMPTLELKPSTTDLTNESVDIIINASDNIGIKQIETPDGQIITKSTLTYTANEDGTYTFKATDLAGNEVVKSITLNNIDSANPVLATELSNEYWSNEELTLSVFAISDKGIKYIELPDGTKVEDNFAEYGISENGTYFIATESLGGNITSEKVVVSNIDKELPTLNLSPSTEDWTNEDVDIIINAEDNIGIDYIVLPDGQLVYSDNHTYTVESNGVYDFIVIDLAGNERKESIEIKNIDKNPPVIENHDDLISVLSNIITLDLSAIKTPSGIHKVILPNKVEIIEPQEKIIKYEVKYNDTYTFTIVDKAGNSIDVDVDVDNFIDKNNQQFLNNTNKDNSNKIPDTSGLNSIILSISSYLTCIGISFLIRRKK